MKFTNELDVKGEFSELISTIEDNLQTKGVIGAEYSDATGLRGLISQIMNIPPSLTGLHLTTSLTCSCSDEASVGVPLRITGVLSATYDDESLEDTDLVGGRLGGATVEIYDDKTLLGTTVTDSNGEYVYTYTPLDVGELSIHGFFDSDRNYYTDSASNSQSSVVKVAVQSILLSSDKQTLSYVDEDTATITAIATDSNDNPISNRTIKFNVIDELGNFVETLTGKTNNEGVATVTYESKNLNDITIKAVYENTESSDLVVEDYYWFNSATTNDVENYFTVASSIKNSYYGFNENGWGMGNISAYTGMPILIDLPSYPYMFSYELYESSGLTLTTHIDDGGWMEKNGSYINLYNTTLSATMDVNHTYGVKPYSDKLEVYKDGILVGSKNVNHTTSALSIATGQSRYCRIKNLKIRSFNNVVLSMDRSFLSYVDEIDEAVLTATVTDGENNPISDCSVNFVITDNNDNLIDTLNGVTDNTGVASVTYNSTGNGDRYIKAVCGKVESDKLLLEDYYYYDKSSEGSRLSEYSVTSYLSASYNSVDNGYYLYRNNNGFDSLYREDISFEAPCTIRGKVYAYSANNTQVTLFAMGGEKNFGIRLSWVDSPRIISIPLTAETSENSYGSSSGVGTTGVWYDLKIDIDSNGILTGTATRLDNNSTLFSFSGNINITSFKGIGLQVLYSSGRYVYWKDFRVSTLMEQE